MSYYALGQAALTTPGGQAGAAAGSYTPTVSVPPAAPAPAAPAAPRKPESFSKLAEKKSEEKPGFLMRPAFGGLKVWQAGAIGIGAAAIVTGVVLAAVRR